MSILSILISSLLLLSTTNPADKIVGEYWNEEKTGKFLIYKCQDSYCGKISWREEVFNDSKNPNPALRSRSIVGMEFLSGFQFDKEANNWKGGKLYSFQNGSTYEGKMWLEDGGKVLKMRGFIGYPIFGKTASFVRVSD